MKTPQNIGGKLDLRALARLHRPTEQELLAREARRLARQGLLAQDIGQAIGIAPAAVKLLLETGQDGEGVENRAEANVGGAEKRGFGR